MKTLARNYTVKRVSVVSQLPFEAVVTRFDSLIMEFMRFNLGDILKKRFSPEASRSLRIVMGNPVTMSSMTIHVPDAGSYAPVTVLTDERPGGVHLTYDTMESYLSSYGNEAVLEVARELDRQVLGVLEQAAE